MLLEGATEHTLIYIAGPMTGQPNYNYEAFHNVERQLVMGGHRYINNPAQHFDGDQGLPWETYIAKAIDAVMNSEAIVVLPGWMDSIGARLEIAVATAIGHVVYSAIEDKPGVYRYVKRDVGDPRGLVSALMNMGEHPLIPQSNQKKTQMPHEEAAELVHGDRQADYGHPMDNYNSLSVVWTGLLLGKLKPMEFLTAEDCTMLMTGVKIVRQMHRPKRDNIVDAHGYLMVHEMISDERNRRGGAN